MLTASCCLLTKKIEYVPVPDYSLFNIIRPTENDINVISDDLVNQILLHNLLLEVKQSPQK